MGGIGDKWCLLFFVLFLFFFSCSKSNESPIEELEPITLDGIEPQVIKGLSWDDLFEATQTIIIPEDPNLFIADINRAEMAEEWVFVLDVEYRNELFSYNTRTNKVKKIGIKGDGPGEYSLIEDFFVNRKEKCLEVMNNKGGLLEIMKYSFDGDFISSEIFKEHYALSTAALMDGNFLISSQGQNYTEGGGFADFEIIDKSGKIIRRISKTPSVLVEWYTPLGMPLSYTTSGSVVGSAKTTPYVYEFFTSDSILVYELSFDGDFMNKADYDALDEEEYDFWYNNDQMKYHTLDRVIKLNSSFFYRVLDGSKLYLGLFNPTEKQHYIFKSFSSGPFGLPLFIGGAVGTYADQAIFYLDPEQLNQIYTNDGEDAPMALEGYDPSKDTPVLVVAIMKDKWLGE